MSILSIASVIEKNRIDSGIAFVPLLDVEIVSPDTGGVMEILRLANNPEPITFLGNVYEAAKFDLQLKSDSGAQPDVSLTVNDYTQAVQGRLQAYNGGIGSNITITIVNTDQLDQAAEVVEFFEVVGASASEYQVTWKLGAANSLARPFPRRKQTKDFCQWRFKDPETCRYVGSATSCDLTLQGDNGCAVKLNTIHFGAFPGINSNGANY